MSIDSLLTMPPASDNNVGDEYEGHPLPAGLEHSDRTWNDDVVNIVPKAGHTQRQCDEELLADWSNPIVAFMRGVQVLYDRMHFWGNGVEPIDDHWLGEAEMVLTYEVATVDGPYVTCVRRTGDADPFAVETTHYNEQYVDGEPTGLENEDITIILPPGGGLKFGGPSILKKHSQFKVIGIRNSEGGPLTESVAVDGAFCFLLDKSAGSAGVLFPGDSEDPITVTYTVYYDRGRAPIFDAKEFEPRWFKAVTKEITSFGDQELCGATIRYWDAEWFRVTRVLVEGAAESDVTADVIPLITVDDDAPQTMINIASLGYGAETLKLVIEYWEEDAVDGIYTGPKAHCRCQHCIYDRSGSYTLKGGNRYCGEFDASQRANFNDTCYKPGLCDKFAPEYPTHPLEFALINNLTTNQPWRTEADAPGSSQAHTRRWGYYSIASLLETWLDMPLTQSVAQWQYTRRGGWRELLLSGFPGDIFGRGHETNYATGAPGPAALGWGSEGWMRAHSPLANYFPSAAFSDMMLTVAPDYNPRYGWSDGAPGKYHRCGNEKHYLKFTMGAADEQFFCGGHKVTRGFYDADFKACGEAAAVWHWKIQLDDPGFERWKMIVPTVVSESYADGKYTLECRNHAVNCTSMEPGHADIESVFAMGGTTVRGAGFCFVNNVANAYAVRGAMYHKTAHVGDCVRLADGRKRWITAVAPFLGATKQSWDPARIAWNAGLDAAYYDANVSPHAAGFPPARDWGRGSEAFTEYGPHGDLIDVWDELCELHDAGFSFVGKQLEIDNGGVAYPTLPVVKFDSAAESSGDLHWIGADGILFGKNAIPDDCVVELWPYLTDRFHAPTDTEIGNLRALLERLVLVNSGYNAADVIAMEDWTGIRGRTQMELLRKYADQKSGDSDILQTDWDLLVDEFTAPSSPSELITWDYNCEIGVMPAAVLSSGDRALNHRAMKASWKTTANPWRWFSLERAGLAGAGVAAAGIRMATPTAVFTQIRMECWVDEDSENPDEDTETGEMVGGSWWHCRITAVEVEAPPLMLALGAFRKVDATHYEIQAIATSEGFGVSGGVLASDANGAILDITGLAKSIADHATEEIDAFQLFLIPRLGSGITFDGDEEPAAALGKILASMVKYDDGPMVYAGQQAAMPGVSLFTGTVTMYDLKYNEPTLENHYLQPDWTGVAIEGGLQPLEIRH